MITSMSGWNYGHAITSLNKFINFSENGGAELTAILLDGSYSLEEFAKECLRAINEAAALNKFTVTIDRSTNKLSFFSDTTVFSFLASTGSNVDTGAFSLMGFADVDLSGQSSYVGDSASGKQFIPQFKLQDYSPFDNAENTAHANIIENTRGDIVEVINYGSINFMKCNILFQTNIIPQQAIREDAQGVDRLRDFLIYCITKGKMEFIEDIEAPAFYTKCILEKTRYNSKGLGFELTDMKNVGWTNYFTSGSLTYREIK